MSRKKRRTAEKNAASERKESMMKRILAVLLAVILLTQAVPLTVLAAEEPEGAEKIIKLGEPVAEDGQEAGGRRHTAESNGAAPSHRSADPLKDSGRSGTAKPTVEDLRRKIDARSCRTPSGQKHAQ